MSSVTIDVTVIHIEGNKCDNDRRENEEWL
jgi:hypothetical protein